MSVFSTSFAKLTEVFINTILIILESLVVSDALCVVLGIVNLLEHLISVNLSLRLNRIVE